MYGMNIKRMADNHPVNPVDPVKRFFLFFVSFEFFVVVFANNNVD